METFKKEKLELYQEEFVLEGSNVSGYLETVKEVLLECEREFSGIEANTYDYICDQLENNEEE
ncbi:hypothetical protein [Alkalicoccobacillus murimartini]|uniref:HicB family RNase H-like nuclease n=1 Tax=Alkalicoccobacillus murimartini TaxID=171685 RepID=A0ABT9YM65_9BACI|nr:hypothetical protein [Alkalicoccobacillus murimartini]MDQ0208943.1 putative HicB family RNase H-like nuclease [Alkalicoccobacillus murimartini]